MYLVYTAFTTAPSDADIMLRISDDMGMTWSDPQKINDDVTANSQFFPSIAVDQSTGHVAVVWYDTRNDPENVKTQFWGALSTDGGQLFPNFQISDGSSEGGGYRDYSGLSFHGGVMLPAWGDNSIPNAMGEHDFEVFVQRVEIHVNP